MLQVRDFLEVNLGSNDIEREKEKQRLEQLFSEIPSLPSASKDVLVGEFLKVVLDDCAELVYRVQATTILGHQAEHLGIKGSAHVGTQLATALTNRFLSVSNYSVRQNSHQRSEYLRDLDGMDLLFFECLSSAIFVTHVDLGLELARMVTDVCPESRVGKFMQALSQKTKRS